MDTPTLEYIIKQRTEGSVLLKKAFVILGYILLFAALATVIIFLSPPLLAVPFFVLDLIFCAMVVFVSWRFLCIEYEITVGSGEIVMTVIYGKSIRKRKLSVAVNSLSEVGLYDDGAYEKLCSMSLQKDYIAVSSLSAPVIYYAVFDEDKNRCVLYFEADDRAIQYIRQQNFSAVRAGNIKKQER